MCNIIMEPAVYPIDWTHNPICQGTHGGTIKSVCPNKEGAVEKIEGVQARPGSKIDDAASALPPLENMENMHIKDDTSTQSRDTEDNSSSFDKLVASAPYDYVLLTDCVFSAELAVPLVNTILCCCGPRTNVICCHEIRDEVSLLVISAGAI